VAEARREEWLTLSFEVRIVCIVERAMRTTCVQCGAVTDGEGSPRCGYSLPLRKVFYCEPCWRKHHRHSPATIALDVILALFAIAGVILAARRHWAHVPWTAFNVSLLLIFIAAMVLLHELAHALTARLLGWRLFKLYLGHGRRVALLRFFGLDYEIRAWPFSGRVLMAPRALRSPRLEYWVISAAGPAANLLILFGLLWLTDVISDEFTRGPAPLAMLAAANLLVLVISLSPYRGQVEEDGQHVPVVSDGVALVTAPFWSDAQVAEVGAAYFAFESLEYIRDGRGQDARALCERGVELYPGALHLRLTRAYACYFVKDYPAARQEWLDVLKRDDLSTDMRVSILNNIAWVDLQMGSTTWPGMRQQWLDVLNVCNLPTDMRALLLNNIAWADLQIGAPELLDEADRYSQEALSSEPGRPPFKGTRGSLLIERGQIDEGLALVQQAFAGNAEPQLRALNACYLALGEALRGNLDKGLEHLAVARRLDDKCILLSKMDERIAQLRDSTQGSFQETHANARPDSTQASSAFE
jgi:hypothetical protein